MLSPRVAQWVEQAEKAGLVVEIENYDGANQVNIRMPEIADNNVLALIHNTERVVIHEFNFSEKSRVKVYKYGLLENRAVVQKRVKYAIQIMGESYSRYFELQAEKALA